MRRFTTTAILLVVALLVSNVSFGQKPEKVNRKTALKYFEDGNWEKAKQLYLELLKSEPDDEELNLYCGISYLNSRIEGEKSLDYLNNVNEQSKPAVVLFKGQAYHYIGNFDMAKMYYEKYKQQNPKLKDDLVADINKRIKQCEVGMDFKKEPREGMFVDNLGNGVNSRFVDYAPVIYEDLKTIVFTSTNANLFNIEYMTYQEKGEEEIYFSTYDAARKKWKSRSKADGKVLNENIDSEQNESSITWSTDKKRFYFYREGSLWVSENLGNPVKSDLGSHGFTDNQIISIVINRNEDVAFIVSDKSGGKGGSDIYMATKNSDGKWSSFKNLESINTTADETSPFLSADGSKLYFASNGYNSIGDYDIFVATKSGNEFVNVSNMGIPINSPANDIHFRLTGKGEEYGYLASDRQKGQGDYDIWRFWTCMDIDKVKINGQLIAKNKDGAGTNLTLMTIDSAVVKSVNPMATGGNYSFTANTETDYLLQVSVDGYATQYFRFTTPKLCIKYDVFQLVEVNLEEDSDGFVHEQRSVLRNAFYNIDEERGDNSRTEFVKNMSTSNPLYSTPEVQVSKFEKDALLANLGRKPILNADGKPIFQILFDFDKATLSAEDADFASRLGEGMKNNPDKKIVISGHTDSKGSASYNKRLSIRRAEAVAQILISKGVSKDQITIEGYGETQLKIKDTDANGVYLEGPASENRRVEIEIL